MPLSDLLEGNGGWGIGAGLVAGAAILLSKQGRPLAKSALVGYFTLSERLKTLAAEATEQAQDLYAEARAEYRDRESADEEIEIVDVVEEEAPPPPPRRPRAGRGKRAAATAESEAAPAGAASGDAAPAASEE
ncbi:MAG: DUF5132 domain-containing protein [Chloroflexota bacterium]